MALTVFNSLPHEVLSNGVIYRLTTTTTYRFCLVSKATLAIVQEVAKAPQVDITLAGDRVHIILDGSVLAFLRQKQKMQILTTLPELLGQVLDVSKEACEDGANPNDIGALIQYINDSESIEKMPLSLVLFDFNTKQIPALNIKQCNLANFLEHAVLDKETLQLARAIRAHPNAKDISGEDLGVALECCCVSRCRKIDTFQEFVQVILSFPNAPNIPAEGLNGLGKILAIAPDSAFVEAILRLPNTKKIPAKGSHGLGAALILAIANGPWHVRAILSLPNAKKIPAEGSNSLAKAMTAAKNKPEILELISSFKAARDLEIEENNLEIEQATPSYSRSSSDDEASQSIEANQDDDVSDDDQVDGDFGPQPLEANQHDLDNDDDQSDDDLDRLDWAYILGRVQGQQQQEDNQ
jgi:hypothetical protein